MARSNSFPSDVYDLLKRALDCNEKQLAAHLGIHPNTLKRWKDGEGGKNAAARISKLWGVILRNSGTEWLEVSQVINWSNVHSIGGKR